MAHWASAGCAKWNNGSSGGLYPMGNCSGELYPMGNCIPPSIPFSVWLIRLLRECVLCSGIQKYNNDLHRHSPNPPETIVWGVWGRRVHQITLARHRRIIVSPRGTARDTVSPQGAGRTKVHPEHRQKSPPRGTGRTRKPKAPTKGILELKNLILRTSSDTQEALHTMAHARVLNHCS